MKKTDILMRVLAVTLGVSCLSTTAVATTWFVNDADTTLDVYCTAAGNDANDGQSKATPKLSVTSVTTSELLQPGDTLYIDTGKYELGSSQNVFTRSGTVSARITVRGSTNGTYLSRSGNNGMGFKTSYADFYDLKLVGRGTYVGLVLDPSAYCSYTRVDVLIPAQRSITLGPGSYSNQFSHGVIAGSSVDVIAHNQNNVWGNSFHSMVFAGKGNGLNLSRSDFLSKFENNVVKVDGIVFPGEISEEGFSGNVLSGSQMAPGCVTLSDLAAAHPDVCVGNIAGNPLFVDEAGGDYHLQSPYGYWKTEKDANGYVTGGAWVTNAAVGMSPGIDFGYENEWASWTNEPSPNGGRVNAGAYGGTEFASKGHPDGQKWLYAASFNDGGNLIGSGVFEWKAGGFADGEKVRLQYTHDGTTWSNIGSTVKANAERYEWTVPAGANGAWTMWRVRTTNSTGWIASTNGAAFSIRGADDPSIAYYVNDASRSGDVYCKAAGSDENTGADPSHPKATLKSVLDTYQLLPGDVVYVDTGVYENTAGEEGVTRLSGLDSGSEAAPVRILGSTNWTAGTVFASASTSVAVMEVTGHHYDVRNITVAGGGHGLAVTGASNRFERITATGNVQGIQVNGTRNALERVLAWKNSEYGVYVEGGLGNTLDHSVAWENGTAALFGAENTLEVKNSVLGGSSGSVLGGSGIPSGDWNVAWAPAMSASRADLASLLAVAPAGTWEHTVVRDPEFVDAAAGDFHLSAGSPAIDAGDPAADAGAEPSPNGGRMNAGLYGGTAEAAKSQTGAWVQLLSFVDGGMLDASATNVIRWNAGNLPSGATLTLWLKRSAGGAWEALATGLNAASGEYEYWKAVEENQSAREAYLKLTLDGSSPEVSSETEKPMEYKDGSYPYYVNDASTVGDVYCSAPGSAAGDGLTPETPMLSLEALISKYKFSAGERIYVDTGTYSTNRTVWVINENMAGSEEKPIRIIGSTNAAAGGSVIGNRTSRQPIGMNIGARAGYLEISNLTFTNVQGNAVTVSNANHITLDGVQVRGATGAGISVLGKAANATVKHSAATGCGTGLLLGECTDVAVEQCVFVDNTFGVSAAANSGATLENSALSASALGAVLYQVQVATNGFKADYNGLHAGGNARVAAGAENVRAWQKASGLDAHSVPGNPLFGDAANFDYHLKTKRTLGRWLDNGQRTTDEESSPLLSAGKPAADGTHPNIGMHGGTARASLPPSGEWLQAVSFNDAGGVGAETDVALRWIASEAMGNQTVKVEVSANGGKTWKTVKTKVKASDGEVSWNVGSTADTPAGLWRVTSETDAGVTDACDAFFAVRKKPLKVYVAPPTVDTNETAYVTAPGAPGNWEATKAAPLDSLGRALDYFDLEGGDTVYVDSGTVTLDSGMSMNGKRSGTATNAVRIVGVTNKPFGGAVVALAARSRGSVLLDLSGVSNVRFEALTFSNAWTGIQAANSSGIEFDYTRITHTVTNALDAQAGANLTLSHSVVDDSVYGGLCVYTGAVVNVAHGYVAASAQLPFVVRGGRANVTNSILAAVGLGKAVFSWQSASGVVASDYNDIRAENGANVSAGSGREAARFLNEWQRETGNDMHSVGYAPLMADEGKFDYHLRSQAGRYDPAEGGYVKTDAETSRLIDLGDPGAAWSAEPKPNGSRANIGVYGGTPEASKSAATNFIAPLTMSDGGTIRGEVDLYWTYSANYAGNEYVNVLLSTDGGTTWTNIGREYVNAGKVSWNSTNAISTGQGKWKVELASNTNVFGQTETLFAIKNDPLKYYVNDASTNGDVYCTATGSATASGTDPGHPMDSLSRLLGKYKLEAGDKVYVDTGTYAETGGVVFSASFGVATNWLTIQGSTNRAAGGTVFTNSSETPVIDLQGMGSVALRDLTLQGGSRGVLLTGATSNRFWRMTSVGASAAGFDIAENSGGNLFDECAAVGFACTGLVQRTAGVRQGAFTGTNEWNGGIFITKGMGTNGLPLATSIVVNATSGRLTVQNSVFCLNGSKDTALVGTAGSLSTDHNDYWRPVAGALLATRVVTPVPTYGVQQQAVDTLAAWRALSGQDGESYSADPLWVDAAELDFHPRSEGGRYDQTKSAWTNDDATSPLIGTGTMADGVRRGVGWYGAAGDGEASRAPKATRLVLLDYVDGGVASGIVTNRWIARGSNLSETVNARYVPSSGVGINIGGPKASDGHVRWDTTEAGSDGAIRWGIGTFEEIAETTPFTLHNGPLTYYVNDGSTNGDVYCTAKGTATNTGLSASSPLPSLEAVFSRYDLEPGDKVLCDAGTYQTGTVSMDWRDSGTADSPVVVQGAPHGKTKISGALQLANAQGVSLRDLSFDSTGIRANALEVGYSGDIAFDGVDVTGSDWSAMKVSCSTNVLGTHMILAHAKTNGLACEANYRAEFAFMTICSNGTAQVITRRQLATGTVNTNRNTAFMSLSNSVVASRGNRVPIYDVYGTVYADHNDLYAEGDALIALMHEGQVAKELRTVNAWYNERGQDAFSLSHEPLFANARYGYGDFHLMSMTGRYDSATGKWAKDDKTSPLLDAGDAGLPVGREPAPNGGRVNLGRYGGTAEASKTPTNAVLTLIALNDGGRASGTKFPITWLARGNTTNALLTIRYIDGTNTTVLASNVLASAGVWEWDTTRVEPSVQGKLELAWKEGTTEKTVQTEAVFSVRNAGDKFKFYVNDTSRTGDEYCTRAGDNNADGLTPATPMADLNRLLEKYKLESGDTVYVDAGRYSGTSTWRVTQDDSAEELGAAPVTIQGATNNLYGGTVLERNGNPVGIQVDYAIGLAIKNITVSNTSSVAIALNSCYETSLEWMTAGNAELGIQVSGGSQVSMSHCVLHDVVRGVSVGGIVATNTVFPTLEHSVIWKPAEAAVAVDGEYRLHAKHNVFAPLANQYAYALSERAVLTADYNAFVLEPDARVFQRRYGMQRMPTICETVGAWVTLSGQDVHSYDGEPDFADAGALDFHLKSRAGRYNPATKKFVTTDKTTSPLVDAGDPETQVGVEPAANGGRINIGLYGGTPQASKSDAAGRYNLLTFNNGGVASGLVALNWNALGTATGTTVRIEVSLDGGKTWPITVGEGIDASIGGVLWNSAERGSSALAKWRLVDEAKKLATVESSVPFILHNSGISYYVNDDEPLEEGGGTTARR